MSSDRKFWATAIEVAAKQVRSGNVPLAAVAETLRTLASDIESNEDTNIGGLHRAPERFGEVSPVPRPTTFEEAADG